MTSGVDEDAFVEEAVRLGVLGQSLALRARASWEQAGISIPFDEFLVEQGLIAPEQRLAILDGREATQISGAPAADPADQEPQPGERHSDCTIVEKLGEGGMGAVFLAKDPTGRPVVLKFLAPALARHESLRARFAREGAILFRLAPHPNLVRVLGIAADAQKPHIIMELLEGQALDQALKQQFNLPPLDAVRIARDAARGLAAIHSAGIIHRDIKPANLFITVDGVVKLIDFGLAKDLRATDGLSRPGMRLGTPHYMAPEQWGNHVVDHRCDLFALGGTLYNMVVGEPPFLGRDTAAVAQKVLSGDYTPPDQIIQRLPEDLPLVIAQLLQPDPNHRYADATRCAADLQRLLDRQPVLVPRLLEQRGGGATKRHPLVPGALFVIGRNDSCLVQLRHPSVSAEHARIRREQHGFVIQDAGSTFGTFVGESPVVRETKLRDGDKIRLGKVVLEFKDEAVATGPAKAPRGSAGHPLIAHEAAEPALEALAEAGDKRVALWLIDLVAPVKKDDAERAALAALVGEETVAPALEKATARRGEQRAWAAARLRELSGLDHGPDAAQWLLWWDTVRRDLPPQIAPRESRRGWGVAVGEGLPGNPTLWLPADPSATVGRGEECALRLTHQSVSRVHATLYRFPRRIVLRDEGSRFGTLINGERVSMAFLAPGDRIEVGNAVLTVVARDQGPVRMTLGTIGLDPRLVEALEALDHPSVTLCTARALHQAARLTDLEQELRPLFPLGAPAALIERVARTYRARAEKARGLLARLLGLPADQANAWRNALAEKRAGLPPQVMPIAWFPEKEEAPASK